MTPQTYPSGQEMGISTERKLSRYSLFRARVRARVRARSSFLKTDTFEVSPVYTWTIFKVELDMEVLELSLAGVKRIRPKVFCDNRGFFRETFHQFLYRQAGIIEDFVQDNHSFSTKGTVRGMHFQRFPGQAKLITVIEGEIFDVVVDIRRLSPTFGQWEGVFLSASQGDQLFIPVGFAHGFCVMSESAHVCYKVSSVYNPLEECGFRYDDPFVGIVWPTQEPRLSERDLAAPLLREVVS